MNFSDFVEFYQIDVVKMYFIYDKQANKYENLTDINRKIAVSICKQVK